MPYRGSMGQAKNKRSQRIRLLEQHPNCCYCGGATPATTLDHVPAKVTFWGKNRPAGLESPACDACNGGTKKLERAAALFSHIRMADDRTPAQQVEQREMAHKVRLDFPGWHHEFHAVPEHEQATLLPPKVRPMTVGPLMQEAMHAVAAKLAFALHYHKTGKIIPPTGFVAVHSDTNVTLLARPLPTELLDAVGPTEMLAQGEHTSEGHFAYRGAWMPDGSVSVFMAHLGEAFHFTMFGVGLDLTTSAPALAASEFPDMRLFRSGELQQADAKALARYHVPLPVWRTGGLSASYDARRRRRKR